MKKVCLPILCLLLISIVRAEGLRITRLEGDVVLRLAGEEEWIPAETGTPLAAGDEVRALPGGRAEWATGAGDLIELAEESAVTVGEWAEEVKSFFLSLGALIAKVAERPNRKFEVRTPVAVVSVRGTEFAVSVDEDDNLETGVVEGEVAVRREGEPETLIAAGQGWVVRRGKTARRLRRIPQKLEKVHLARLAVLRRRLPGVREDWKAMSADERRAARERIKTRWRDMPAERKERLRQKMRSKWKDLSPEQRGEILKKNRIGRERLRRRYQEDRMEKMEKRRKQNRRPR